MMLWVKRCTFYNQWHRRNMRPRRWRHCGKEYAMLSVQYTINAHIAYCCTACILYTVYSHWLAGQMLNAIIGLCNCVALVYQPLRNPVSHFKICRNYSSATKFLDITFSQSSAICEAVIRWGQIYFIRNDWFFFFCSISYSVCTFVAVIVVAAVGSYDSAFRILHLAWHCSDLLMLLIYFGISKLLEI